MRGKNASKITMLSVGMNVLFRRVDVQGYLVREINMVSSPVCNMADGLLFGDYFKLSPPVFQLKYLMNAAVRLSLLILL